LELAPNNQIIAVQLIDLEVSTKSFDKALQVAQQQINKSPDSAVGHFLEGRVYAAQGKWDPAEKSLTKALTLSRDLTAAYSLLSSVYLARNKLSEAAQQLETLVAKSPNDTRDLMTLGIIY